MRIAFTKARAGRSDVMRIDRDDGTAAFERERSGFVVHDLLHFAVETVLDEPYGLYGVFASGREPGEFGRDPETGAAPPKPGSPRVDVENVVNLFAQERAGALREDQFADAIALACPDAASLLTEPTCERVRRRFDELLGAWDRLEPGDSLVLQFPTS